MVVAIRSCLGVDIGSQSIRVAHIEMGKAGPRVLALLEERMKPEVATAPSETQRQTLIARQLQEMLKKAKIRTKNAIFCIPGQSVFIKRPPKLPKTTEERLDRIIRFEARQQIPFPLDKTIMEYQVFDEGSASEINVLLAAIKREYIMNFMKLVRRTGLSPLAISVSSLALYNFHELNSSARDLLGGEGKKEKPKKEAKDKDAKKGGLFGLGKKKTDAKPDKAAAVAPEDEDAAPLNTGFEEVRAYVNLGAALMDLAIPKPGSARMIGFTRSVPLAGNEMDRAIAQKLGLKTLDEARQIKETETAVLSTEFEVEGDAESINMEASEATTAIADRIISELRRSLDYYISQPDGVAVDAIVLSGGLTRLPFFRSYIEEKMGLPVELAEPLHQQLRLPDNPPDPFCPFVVAVGLALQGLSLAQNTINFLPEEVKTMMSVRQHPFEMIGMAVMLLAIIGLSYNVGAQYVSEFNRELNEYNLNFAKYNKQNTDIQKAQERNGKIFEAYDKLSKAVGMPDFCFMVMQYAVLEKRPPDVVLDEVAVRLDGYLVIRGKSPNNTSINRFLDDLMNTLYFVYHDPTNNKGVASFITPPMTAQPDPRFSQPVFDFIIVARTPMRRPRIRSFGDQPGYKAPDTLFPTFNNPMMRGNANPYQPQGPQIRR